MRYDFIEPLISSTIRVLDSVLQSDIAKGDCTLTKFGEIEDDIAIVVNVKGDAEGSIILNMPRATALNISNVMFGENFETLSSLGMDSISELANMIAGNATSTLNNLGFDFKVLPPRILVRGERQPVFEQTEAFQIPLFTEYGEITVNVTLNTN